MLAAVQDSGTIARAPAAVRLGGNVRSGSKAEILRRSIWSPPARWARMPNWTRYGWDPPRRGQRALRDGRSARQHRRCRGAAEHRDDIASSHCIPPNHADDSLTRLAPLWAAKANSRSLEGQPIAAGHGVERAAHEGHERDPQHAHGGKLGHLP